MLKFLFGGRMSRLPYAFVAIPISAVLSNDGFLLFLAVKAWEPIGRLFNTSKIGLADLFSVMAVVFTALILILVIAVVKRLSDAGWSNWLVVPVLLRPAVLVVMAYLKYEAAARGTPISDAVHQGLSWASQGLRWYELGLVLILLIVPGRRTPSSVTEPASAF